MVLCRSYLYGDLLPAQLSCRDSQAVQRPLLSDRGRRTVRRFPRLQAVQARRRAWRAHTARLLIETTDLPITEVAFAAGFTSIRQFNDTIREVFAVTPRALRRGRGVRDETVRGEIPLRLPFRTPFDTNGMLHFLGTRAVAGVETF